MFAMLVGKFGEPTVYFHDISFFGRKRNAPQFGRKRNAPQSGRSLPRMDEALKAGIGAAVCSVIILFIMFMVLHSLPVSIG
jgi:hypothetical protein